ncbi:MAG: hypothetical protein GY850_36590 [bacterium]|nr:hypothetical protein [bacterium]
MKRLTITMFVLLWILPNANAGDLSGFYDNSTLNYWRGRYKRSTPKILNRVIWPALLNSEKRRLGRKPIIEFPRYPDGKFRQHPLAFYVPADRPNIVFPIFSLKFLDDLCTAYAWLQVNGYSLETVAEYTAILKYGKPPSGGFPPPLKAMQIPQNALDNPQVDELALGHFVTSRTFLLLHEMGHILYGHNARTYAESVRNEQQSDRFAASVMQRTALPPLGILVFFMADAHWSGFPASGRDTHPLSGERVRALADHFDNPSLSKKLLIFGKFLDDPDIRAGFAATGKAGDLAALAPRRPGELPRRRAQSGRESRSALFGGFYRGQLVQFLEPAPTAMEMVLERKGDRVQGNYTFGLGFGRIVGRIVGERLYFNWEWADNYGHGVLEAGDDGNFTGTWGYREARSGAGTWTGRRGR